MITEEEARTRAARWVATVAPEAEPVLYEFSLGWVISARLPPGPQAVEIPNMILDRRTGELTVGGTLSAETMAQWYEARQDPRRRDDPFGVAEPPRRRSPTDTASRLQIGDRIWMAESLHGDEPPEPPRHPAVAAFYRELPDEYRERGCERVSEAAVISAALWAEEARRRSAGLPPLTLADVRAYLAPARLSTHRAGEFPSPETAVRPSPPTLLLLDFLGISIADVVSPWSPEAFLAAVERDRPGWPETPPEDTPDQPGTDTPDRPR